jgi:hypothetical protein
LVYGTLMMLFIIFPPRGLAGAPWNKLTGARQVA